MEISSGLAHRQSVLLSIAEKFGLSFLNTRKNKNVQKGVGEREKRKSCILGGKGGRRVEEQQEHKLIFF